MDNKFSGEANENAEIDSAKNQAKMKLLFNHSQINN